MPGEIYALFGAMMFGASHLAVRRANSQGWDSHQLLLAAAVINLLMFTTGLSYLVATGQLPPIRVEAIALFVLAGSLTALLGRSMLFMSIARIGAARAASYRVSSPLVTVAMAYLLVGERLNPTALVGAAVVLVGLWQLTRETSGHGQQPLHAVDRRTILIGILLGVLSSFCFGNGQVFRKIALSYTQSAMLGAFVGTLVSLIAFSAIALQGDRRREMAVLLRKGIPWSILIVGLLTGLAQFSIFFSYEHARVSTASVLGATEPVWTFLAASLLMRHQERLNWRLALCILTICAGAALVVGGG
jgi:drug/metabolite transporter (DMT)-like permease